METTATIDLTPIFQAIIALLAALVTYKLIPWIKSKTTESQQKNMRALVKVLVYAAEQLYGAGNGAEKLQYVRDELNRRGFEVDFDEIEAAVGEFLNKGIGPDYDKQIADAIASDKTPSVEDDAPEMTVDDVTDAE